MQTPPSPAGLTTSDACEEPTFCLRLDHLAPSQRLSGITEPSRGNDSLITRPHSPSRCLLGVGKVHCWRRLGAVCEPTAEGARDQGGLSRCHPHRLVQ
ncbi:hypothetical protein EYF80_045524 [Liparis tanakae]|uniref:Uncharacterized protein n=1 Tax=Liparis tanakae TaxID=230148 RepID=A0A4Z2FT01_9TELE|nr:hypothetical protein EYF80_045524 [Liparis tanakae]